MLQSTCTSITVLQYICVVGWCYGPVLDRNGRHSTRLLTDTYRLWAEVAVCDEFRSCKVRWLVRSCKVGRLAEWLSVCDDFRSCKVGWLAEIEVNLGNSS